MTGPAPKPAEQRRRRNAPLANTLKLPSEGRGGETPRWPLRTDAPDVWAELWRTPQAVAWERLGWTRIVARYVQVLAEAEVSLSPGLLGEVRQLEDRLGLTPLSMLRLRWEVTLDEVGAKRDEKPKQSAGEKARSRLKLADAVEA